jgi:hypothetical protein
MTTVVAAPFKVTLVAGAIETVPAPFRATTISALSLKGTGRDSDREC